MADGFRLLRFETVTAFGGVVVLSIPNIIIGIFRSGVVEHGECSKWFCWGIHFVLSLRFASLSGWHDEYTHCGLDLLSYGFIYFYGLVMGKEKKVLYSAKGLDCHRIWGDVCERNCSYIVVVDV